MRRFGYLPLITDNTAKSYLSIKLISNFFKGTRCLNRLSRYLFVGQEGRAGMAAILDPDHAVDLERLAHSLQKSLPPYARPLFVRIMETLPMTGTFWKLNSFFALPILSIS